MSDFESLYLSNTNKQCAKLLGISVDQIRYKAKKLGLTKPKRIPSNKIVVNMDDLINYYEDHTLEECSQKFGLSARQLGERLRKHGIRTGRHYSKLHDKEIIEDLKRLTMAQCCEKYNCSKSALRSLLRKHDITNLSRYKSVKVDPVKIIEYYKNHTQKQCSEHFGCSKHYVSKVLRDYDIDTNIHFGSKFQDKIGNIVRKRWTDPVYCEKMREIRPTINKVSSVQKLLYRALDEMGAEYYREYDNDKADKQCIIGKYQFDCVIPRENDKRLLIEVQGDYHHSRHDIIKRDKERRQFYLDYLTDRYDLKYIWEHEFLCHNKVIDKLHYWLGTDRPNVDYSLNQLVIRRINSNEYKPFLTLYHYLSNPGRGGIVFGAFLGDKLVACCCFSQLIRQNVPEDRFHTRELSRVCIHPNYRKKNLCSWLISKCIKKLPKSINTIVSYADSTFNHDGTIYYAANFRKVSDVRPDYWYIDRDGYVMHKKCLYNKSKNLKLSEAKFARKFGYKKVKGFYKHKFIYTR